jgi:hypothetical protein
MLLVKVVLVSLLTGQSVDVGNYPRVYEHFEPGEMPELYARDGEGNTCDLAVRGPQGGWTLPTLGQKGEEWYAKYYPTEEEGTLCPVEEE